MTAPTSDERREVAARLRNDGRALTAIDMGAEIASLTLDDAIGIAHNATWEDCFDRLAELIEPDESDVIRCGQCDYCLLNEYGELWCMRDPNHTGHGRPTNKDGFCCWAEPIEAKKETRRKNPEAKASRFFRLVL